MDTPALRVVGDVTVRNPSSSGCDTVRYVKSSEGQIKLEWKAKTLCTTDSSNFMNSNRGYKRYQCGEQLESRFSSGFVHAFRLANPYRAVD
ncbi:hypothetical protein J6590_100198 [Homalodisca vitripennis]|nr:hypothetical protein J6590_100198 [Homalodisca vitripennis]